MAQSARQDDRTQAAGGQGQGSMKDALWLLGSGIVTLAIVIAAIVITLHLTAPAHAVQTSCTVTTGWH